MDKNNKNIIINELTNFLNNKDDDTLISMREKLYKYSYNKSSLNFEEDINDNIKIVVEDILVLYERFKMVVAFCRIKRKNYKSMYFILLFNNMTSRFEFIGGENINYITPDDIKTWGTEKIITIHSINICMNNNIIDKLLVYKNKSFGKGSLIKNIKKDNSIERKVYDEPVSPLLFNKDKNNNVYKSHTFTIPDIYKYLGNIYGKILGIDVSNNFIFKYEYKIIHLIKSFFKNSSIRDDEFIITNTNIDTIVINKTTYDIFNLNMKIVGVDRVNYDFFLIKEPYTDLTLLVLPPNNNYNKDIIINTIIEDHTNTMVIYNKSSKNYNIYKKYLLDNGVIKSISTTHDINGKYDYNKDSSVDLFELDADEFNIIDLSYTNPYNANIKPITKLLERDYYVNITFRDIYDKSINDCITNLILKEKDQFITGYGSTTKNIAIEICNLYKIPYICTKDNVCYGIYNFELKINNTSEKLFGIIVVNYRGGEQYDCFGFINANYDLPDIDKIAEVLYYITAKESNIMVRYCDTIPMYIFMAGKWDAAMILGSRIIRNINTSASIVDCMKRDNDNIKEEVTYIHKLN